VCDFVCVRTYITPDAQPNISGNMEILRFSFIARGSVVVRDTSSRNIWIIGTLLPDHTASHFKRQKP